MNRPVSQLLITFLAYAAAYIIFFFGDYSFSISNLTNNTNVPSGILIPYSLETIWEFTHRSSLPDLQFFYSGDWLNNNIVLLNLASYKLVLYADLIYPLIYSSFYFSLISFLSGKTEAKESNLSFVPFGAAFFDYAENFYMLYIIKNYSSNPDFFISTAGYVTLAKHILLLLSLILVFVYLFKLLISVKKNIL